MIFGTVRVQRLVTRSFPDRRELRKGDKLDKESPVEESPTDRAACSSIRVWLPVCALLALLAAPAEAELGCRKGQSADLSPLVDLLEGVPEAGWLRVNVNSFKDVWTPQALRPSSGSIASSPEKLIRAWSSFAWDCRRGDLLLFGGGHANYSGNDTYRWRATTRLWERMSLPSDVIGPFGTRLSYIAIDGAFAAPVGAHTYDNNIYLPFIDRFLVVGGSPWNTSLPFVTPTGPDTLRVTGPYTFDTAKADPGKVGGTTGSHVKAKSDATNIVGGMMWQNRDLYSFMPAWSLPMNFTGGTTAYAGSAGEDIVYLSARANQLSSVQTLYEYRLVDADDSLTDTITIIGVPARGTSGRGAGAFDPHLNAFVRTAKSSPRYDVADGNFVYWDLSKPGPTNRNVLFTPTDVSGGWILDRGYGMDYDPVRRQYLLWAGDADVWVLRPPSKLSPLGWTIERVQAAGTEAPVYPYSGYSLEPGGGVLGKWKYIPELDAFMGLENPQLGNVWLYKPVGWHRPGTTPPPTISLSADPLAVEANQSSTLVWSTTDATACVASGGWSGARGTSGSEVIGLLAIPASFTLTCSGPAGQSTRTVTVQIVPPLVLFANPTQVLKGAATTLSWSAPWATSCLLSGGLSGLRGPTGSESSGPISVTTTFTITCSGQGSTVTKSVTVSVASPPTIAIAATPATVGPGATSVLHWSANNATSCEASRGWTGPRPIAGSETVGPIAASTRFDLTCTGPGGTRTAQVLLTRSW